MSERITAHFLLLDRARVVRDDAGARALVAAALADEPQGGRLRRATSTGAWLPMLTAELCRRWSIEGLGFLADDLRVLAPPECERAARAVDALLARLEAGDRPRDPRGLGDQWHLIISPADLAEFLRELHPSAEVDEENGEDFAFLQFLVNVQIAAGDAIESESSLLYWCCLEWPSPRPEA
ncbi:MAG: hypothetical protein U0599_11155 [Vicinamibacteria bacterium]